MEPDTINLLLIEDNPDDALLIEASLSDVKDRRFRLEHATRLSEGLERLSQGGIDAVLSDLSLPDSHGISTVIQIHAQAPNVPVIVMTGYSDERLGAAAVQEGAQDYLVKGQVDSTLLSRTIYYSIQREQAEEKERLHTQQMEAMFQIASLLGQPRGFEEKCKDVLEELVQIGQADSVTLRVPDESGENLNLVAAAGPVNQASAPRYSLPQNLGHPKNSVLDIAMEQGQVVLANDYDRQPYATDYGKGRGIKSLIVLPLSYGELRLGVITLSSRQANHFTPDHIRLLSAIGDHLGMLLQNAKLSHDLQTRSDEMAVVDEVARIITSTLDTHEVYEMFALELKKLVEFDRMTINLIDAKADTAHIKYLYGIPILGRRLGDIVPLAGTLTQAAMDLERSSEHGEGFAEAKRRLDLRLRSVGLHSGMAALLKSKGAVVGSLVIMSSQPDAFGLREQAILERLGGQIASSVENAELFQQTLAADAELRKLSRAVEQSPVGVIITDTKTCVEYVNPRFTQVTGYTLEEVAGKPVSFMKSGRTDPKVYQQLWDCLNAGLEWHGQFLNRKKGGSLYWAEQSISSLRDANGAITHYIAVEEDITKRKQLEEELLQSQKMETVGQLAGGVAHDFNNLLTAIIGYSQIALPKSRSETDICSYLEEITKAAERASKLINQLLAFSRRQMIEPKVINLNDLILDMDKMIRRLIGENIELVTLPAMELELVKVDPGQIEQVLMNLVVNARDSMPRGGTLTIETANFALGAGRAKRYAATPNDPYIILSVTDTGVGMPKHVKDRIFEPFFTTKEVGQGTGLGLSTCYGIITQSRGHIEVESEDGAGTSFKIYLPVTAETVPASSLGDNSGDLVRGTETILLAEDEPMVLSMAAQVLSQHGYRLLEACNGEEALRIAQGYPGQIDILVTDMIMPKIGGLELMEQLRSRQADLKVLLTSGYTDGAMFHRDYLPPETGFLPKPYMPVVLAQKVREVLDQSSAHRE